MTTNTLRVAGKALEQTTETLHDLRDGMHEVANRGLEEVRHSAHVTRQRLDHYTQAGTRYVAENPYKAALIAAAVGAAVAGLVVAWRRRHEPGVIR